MRFRLLFVSSFLIVSSVCLASSVDSFRSWDEDFHAEGVQALERFSFLSHNEDTVYFEEIYRRVWSGELELSVMCVRRDHPEEIIDAQLTIQRPEDDSWTMQITAKKGNSPLFFNSKVVPFGQRSDGDVGSLKNNDGIVARLRYRQGHYNSPRLYLKWEEEDKKGLHLRCQPVPSGKL